MCKILKGIIHYSLRKSLFLFIILSVNSCKKNDIEGYYFDKNCEKIYEFNDNKLIVYNITDSLKSKYLIKIKNKKILVKNENIELNYTNDKDSLWIFDDERLFSDSYVIGLKEFEIGNVSNYELLTQNFWHTSYDEVDFWFEFISDENMNYGKAYFKEKKDSIKFIHTFSFDGYLYFDKFRLYSIRSSLLNPNGYILSNINKDSLILLDLYNFNKVKFNNYISKFDSNLYNRWVNFNQNDKDLSIFNYEGRFYFGDTIEFTKDNKFTREIKNYYNYYYQDTIKLDELDSTKFLKMNFQKKEIPFKVGLNSKYLFFNKPINLTFEVVNLSRDTLILKSLTTGKSKTLKYVLYSQ